MKKYITITALLAAGTACVNAIEAVTLHGVTFDSINESGKNTNSYENKNVYLYSGASWGWPKSYSGLYVTKNAGMQFNTGAGGGGGDVTVKYLFLDGSLNITNTESKCGVGTLAWNYTGNTLNVSGENTWADINANYGNLIDVSGMTSGNLYLNTNGALTLSSALGTDVIVSATFAEEQFVDGYSRTLLSGDFSTWTGKVNILDASGNAIDSSLYQIEKTATGLSVITASIPEPSAFGLLAGIGALALVASRRRRK